MCDCLKQKFCPYCGKPIELTTPNIPYSVPAPYYPYPIWYWNPYQSPFYCGVVATHT